MRGHRTEPHIDPEDFLRAIGEYGEQVGPRAWQTHVHLLRGCPECLQRVLHHFDLASAEELASLEAPIAELERRRNERLTEPLLAWLASLPSAQRLERVDRDEVFHTEAMVEALLGRCRQLWNAEPYAALELCRLAEVVLERAAAADALGSTSDLPQHRARIWAYRGNALRILSDLRAAEEAFQNADRLLAEGWFDEMVPAEVLALKASTLRALRRFADAREAIGEAVRLYGICEKWHLQGQELLTSAKIHVEAGHPQEALKDLRRAGALIDPEQEPRLSFVALSIELHLLCQSGQYRRALTRLPEARLLAAEHGSPTDRLRVRWAEGLVAAGRGDPDGAEATLREAREGFIAQGIGYDAALVTLDLAALYAHQGRTGEIRELAGQMLPIFCSRDVHREALAALALFRQAAEREQLTEQLVGALGHYLQAARHNPSLRFEPPTG